LPTFAFLAQKTTTKNHKKLNHFILDRIIYDIETAEPNQACGMATIA